MPQNYDSERQQDEITTGEELLILGSKRKVHSGTIHCNTVRFHKCSDAFWEACCTFMRPLFSGTFNGSLRKNCEKVYVSTRVLQRNARSGSTMHETHISIMRYVLLMDPPCYRDCPLI